MVEASNSTKAALTIIEARACERSAIRLAPAALMIGTALAFTDSAIMAWFGLGALLCFALALGSAEIHWAAARDYLAWAADDEERDRLDALDDI